MDIRGIELYIIKEFQRLKEQERIGWSAKRKLSKINYRIHTDAIRCSLIPAEVTPQQAARIYVSEADVLNAVLIGEGLPQGDRLVRLNRIAIQQMRVLEDTGRKYLK